jgi:diamine N-acetyltransferase
MISLREIDYDNFIECVDLEHKDERFVGSAVFTLANAYVVRHHMTTYGIYKNDTMVGLVQIRDKPSEHGNVYGFSEMFIADNHLRKGYGSEAVTAILNKLKYEKGFNTVKICVDEENEIAMRLYKKCGFIEGKRADFDNRYIEFSINLT